MANRIATGSLLVAMWDSVGSELSKANPVLAMHVEEAVAAHRVAHQDRMREAFDKVADPDDWRASIDAVVQTDNPAEIEEAITHFTATVATVTRQECGCCFRFQSIGYRAGPAGDH